jgi:AcrR family transcriptional regulator
MIRAMGVRKKVVTRAPRGRGRPLGTASRAMRTQILQVARDVMIEGSFATATVRHIAERAGVDSALIQYYFGSKEGLRDAVVDNVVAEVAASMAAFDDGLGTVSDRARRVIRGYVSLVRANPVASRLLVREVLLATESGESPRCERVLNLVVNPLIAALSRIVEEGRQRGELLKLDPRAVVAAIALSCVGLSLADPLLRLGRPEGHGPLGDLGDAWLDVMPTLFIEGLRAR